MDGMVMLLALVVTISVIGQLLLFVWGAWRRSLDDRQVALERARLVEEAADRQLLTAASHTAKLETFKGVPHAND